MFKPLFAILVSAASCSLALADEEAQIDPKLAARSTVVIRGQRLRTMRGALHPTDEVKVLKVLKNDEKRKFDKMLRVGRGEFSPPIPDKPCTVYLKESKKPKGWFLVGVSHPTDAKKEKTSSTVAPWQSLFAKQRWYQNQQGKETVFRGKLVSVPKADAPSTLQRTSYYRLGDRTIYTGAKRMPVLEKLAGRQVEIRGKAVDFELEGQAVREIWPAAVRLQKVTGLVEDSEHEDRGP